MSAAAAPALVSSTADALTAEMLSIGEEDTRVSEDDGGRDGGRVMRVVLARGGTTGTRGVSCVGYWGLASGR